MIRNVDQVLRRKWIFYALTITLYKMTKMLRCHRLKYDSKENHIRIHKRRRFLHYIFNYMLMILNAGCFVQWTFNLIYTFYYTKNPKTTYEAQNYFLFVVLIYVITLSFAVMSLTCVLKQQFLKETLNELLKLTNAMRLDMRCELKMPANFLHFLIVRYFLCATTVTWSIVMIVRGVNKASIVSFTYVGLYEFCYCGFVLIQITFLICYENLIQFQSRNLLHNDVGPTKWTIRHQIKLANLQHRMRKLNSTFLLLVYVRTFIATTNLYQTITCSIFAQNLSRLKRINASLQWIAFPLLQIADVFIICSLGSELSKKFEQFKNHIFVSFCRLKDIESKKNKKWRSQLDLQLDFYQLRLTCKELTGFNAFHTFQFKRENLLSYMATLACTSITYVQYYVSEAGLQVHAKQKTLDDDEMMNYDLFYSCYTEWDY